MSFVRYSVVGKVDTYHIPPIHDLSIMELEVAALKVIEEGTVMPDGAGYADESRIK